MFYIRTLYTNYFWWHVLIFLPVYVLSYVPISDDPSFTYPVKNLTVVGNKTSTVIGGLSPYTIHRLTVSALNSAGHVTSEEAELRTGESSPDGVRQLQAEARDTGRSLLLRWSPPGKNYIVYTFYWSDHSISDTSSYWSILSLKQKWHHY